MLIKSTAILAGGMACGQAIAFFGMLALTNVYTPESFGEYSVFIAFASILSSVATFKYDSVVLIENDESLAQASIVLSALILLGYAAILWCSLSLANSTGLFDGYIKSSIDIWVLVIAVALCGLGQVVTNCANKAGFIVWIAVAVSAQQALTIGVQYFLSADSDGALGLELGYVTGFVGLLLLLWPKLKVTSFFSGLSFKSLKLVADKYKDQAVYGAPFSLVNMLSLQFLILGCGYFYSANDVGLYSLAYKLIVSPLAVISIAYSSVFIKKLSSDPNLESFDRSFLFGIFFYSGISLVYLVGAELVLKSILSPAWWKAIEYSFFLIPLAVCNAAEAGVGSVFAVAQKNKVVFFWQIIYLLGSLLVLYTMSSFKFIEAMLAYVLFGSLMYIALYRMGRKVLSEHLGLEGC